MDDVKAKQEIIEKIKASTNILVTVSNGPSVDALSAALGLTLILDKLEKHATAIFSGTIPPAIEFLQPEKTFDDTTDSLRDFIIALSKEKADHLRYKVDGDVVKIFITPYKTTITSNDLEFSQGDYNVELVIALGVDNQDHLDAALEAHGQILHDATIVTVTSGDQSSTLGGIDWHDGQASSLSEMIAGLAEALKTDKTQSLLDQQISTALLTGIVAQTDRFSNTHTTSSVMTIAAQLMGAGADQQLIAVKLQESHDIHTQPDVAAAPAAPAPQPAPVDLPVVDGSGGGVAIAHDAPTLEQVDQRVKTEQQAQAAEVATAAVAQTDIPSVAVQPTSAYALDESTVPAAVDTPPVVAPTPEASGPAVPAPSDDPGLSHSYLGTQPSFDASVNSTGATGPVGVQVSAETLDHGVPPVPGSTDVNAAPAPNSAYAFTPDPVTDIPSVAAPAPVPATPASLGLPMPPAVPDLSAPPVVPPIMSSLPTPTEPALQPEILGDILASDAPAVSSMPPVIEPMSPIAPPAAPGTTPTDPGQFRIPGQ